MQTLRTTHHGARIYSPLLLAVYDFLIMQVLTPYVWRCRASHFLALYRKCMSPNHADIGVGTGYMLDRCHYRPGEVRIGLFDLQSNCLKHTAARIARFTPETRQCDALQPIPASAGGKFDSIALGGILHCIPGNLSDKGIIFDNIRPLMHANTTVFGYTILNQGVDKTLLSKTVFFMLEQLKVINGVDDAPDQLRTELNQRFAFADVQVIGCLALFSAHTPFHPAQ